MDFDAAKIIANTPTLSKSIEKYIWIEESLKQTDFHKNPEFQKRYNGFYRVRQRSKEWYAAYFGLLGEQALAVPYSYQDILRKLYEVGGKLEVSFASKLVASVNPTQPIWDKFVLENLGLLSTWKKSAKLPLEKRMVFAVQIYESIKDWYAQFLSSNDGKRCVQLFDDVFSQYRDKLSDLKKVDFLLWSNRD